MTFDDLEINVRTVNLLKNNGVTSMAHFMNLHRDEVMKWPNAGIRTWRDIHEAQLDAARRERRESSLGQAAALIKQLNELAPDLQARGFFFTRDTNQRLRIGRFINAGDFDDQS